MFLVQAEDGIRHVVQARGLANVYKVQHTHTSGNRISVYIHTCTHTHTHQGTEEGSKYTHTHTSSKTIAPEKRKSTHTQNPMMDPNNGTNTLHHLHVNLNSLTKISTIKFG